jgi:hypothetical protein
MRKITAFTIKDGAQQPNLMASPNVCPKSYAAFKITETLPVESNQWGGSPVCPVTAELPPPMWTKL